MENVFFLFSLYYTHLHVPENTSMNLCMLSDDMVNTIPWLFDVINGFHALYKQKYLFMFMFGE